MRSLPPTTTPARLRRGSRPLLALGVLLALSGGQASAQAPWDGPDPQRRDAMLRQQAEAMARFSSRQRRDYFEARRELERRQSGQRLDQLSRVERCLEQARGVPAVERCQRSLQDQRLQQRRQEMADLADLQRRFGLPGWGGRGGWDSRPAPRPQGPSSSTWAPYGSQPYNQPYSPQPLAQQPYAPQPFAPQPFGQPYGQPWGGLPGAVPGVGGPVGSSLLGSMLQSLLGF